MSAFRRRTTFAAPVVLTVAACSSAKDGPKPRDAFPETWRVTMQQNMTCIASVPGPTPAPPQEVECPPGMTGHLAMTLARIGDRCAIVPAGCHEPACARPTTPCPLPAGQKLARKIAYVWVVEKRGELCHAEEENPDCAPGADCNPPAPREFPCPPGVTEEKPLRYAELPDLTCVVVPEGCTDTSCANEPIACPPRK